MEAATAGIITTAAFGVATASFAIFTAYNKLKDDYKDSDPKKHKQLHRRSIFALQIGTLIAILAPTVLLIPYVASLRSKQTQEASASHPEEPILVPHHGSSESSLMTHCSGNGSDDFSQQVCDQLELYRNTIDKLGSEVGASGVDIVINSDRRQNGLFAGVRASYSTMFDVRWIGTKEPSTVIALSFDETGNAWDAAQEFVQRLKDSVGNTHR